MFPSLTKKGWEANSAFGKSSGHQSWNILEVCDAACYKFRVHEIGKNVDSKIGRQYFINPVTGRYYNLMFPYSPPINLKGFIKGSEANKVILERQYVQPPRGYILPSVLYTVILYTGILYTGTTSYSNSIVGNIAYTFFKCWLF